MADTKTATKKAAPKKAAMKQTLKETIEETLPVYEPIIRQSIAAMAMQGLLSNPSLTGRYRNHENLVRDAVAYTDIMLRVLRETAK